VVAVFSIVAGEGAGAPGPRKSISDFPKQTVGFHAVAFNIKQTMRIHTFPCGVVGIQDFMRKELRLPTGSLRALRHDIVEIRDLMKKE
jgi:hypothetical protein